MILEQSFGVAEVAFRPASVRPFFICFPCAFPQDFQLFFPPWRQAVGYAFFNSFFALIFDSKNQKRLNIKK
jgi:hypothetical protein